MAGFEVAVSGSPGEPVFRTQFNFRSVPARSTAFGATGEDLTQQSFKEDCDINTIVRRFGLTGQLPQDVRAPTYGDFTAVTDFHSAMNALREAQEAFMLMPAEVRERFRNDPGAFVDFCSDPANAEEARKLGLVDVPEVSAVKGSVEPAGGPVTVPASSAPVPSLISRAKAVVGRFRRVCGPVSRAFFFAGVRPAVHSSYLDVTVPGDTA